MPFKLLGINGTPKKAVEKSNSYFLLKTALDSAEKVGAQTRGRSSRREVICSGKDRLHKETDVILRNREPFLCESFKGGPILSVEVLNQQKCCT